ncbi:metalloregulator ArsR/SmtB family transcription factor [Amycolatopsis sp. H6(2020)]|nr:metalloregulator ArsR/SmtB family transcription factor [Amycolatopsis sp. H6(2020)]
MRDEGSRPSLFEELARIGKALGNGKRLEIIEVLAQGPRGVVELAKAAGLHVTTTSAHLQTLKHAGLVSAERDGTTIRYSLASNRVAALYSQLLEVATAQLADVDTAARRYLGPDDTEAIGRDELVRRVSAGEAILVDVRPAVEYAVGHIPGAQSIPLDELVDRLEELPPELEVVAYCRGVYCAFSHDAIRLLTAHGRRAVRLAEGILEWQVAGHPIVTENQEDGT